MRIRLLALLAVAAVLLAGNTARAGYMFSFDQSNYTVAVGSTINVEVFLTQTSPTTGLTSPGLNQGGVQLNYNQTIANVSAIKANDSASGGPFDAVNTQTSIGSGSAYVTVGKTDPTAGVTASTSVLLGTFTFTGVSAGSILAVTADPFPTEDVNVLADGTVLDSMIANSSAVITVVAVPEPSTLLLTGVLGLGGAVIAWRRRHRRPQISGL